MRGIAILLTAYLIGELISRIIGGFIPGSIVGMITLMLMLNYRVVNKLSVKEVCEFLLSNMVIFFAPVGVGIITVLPDISDNILSMGVIIVVSMVLVMATVGLIAQKMEKRR